MNNTDIFPQIKIERPLYQKDQLREQLRYEDTKKNLLSHCCGEKLRFKRIITKAVPSIRWLGNYDWKGDATSDLIAGITCAIMHIPQGMAYALLGNVPPVVGIYMAVFPVLVYVIFGTSRHNSMGTFSIACLMTGKAVLEHSDPAYFKDLDVLEASSNTTDVSTGYTPIQVATTVTFVAAVVQLAMYFLRLGAASALLSDMLVNAFTAGAAVQVVSTQIKDLLGISLPRYKGYFALVYTVIDIIKNLEKANHVAILISVIAILILCINNEILKPIVAKRTSIPIPIELVAVVSGTLISQYFFLSENYGIKAIGDIPTGLPEPALPPLSLFKDVFLDGTATAIVSYVTSLSLAMMWAQKVDYEVDANQELLAMGASNIVGSLFSCMPVCASLSRSMIQLVVGGKTQLVSIIASVILVGILLWLGPFFEPLPRCVLASVIVVSLKGMLMQVKDIKKFWKLSKLDAAVWIMTFFTVVLVGMDVGLLVGVAMSLISIFIFSFKPYTCLLGSVPHTDLYLDITKYKGAKEIDGMKLFHYSGGLNFATKNIFRDELYKLVDLNPQKEHINRKKLEATQKKLENSTKTFNEKKLVKLSGKINMTLKCVIMDFSSLSYIDPSGVSMLQNVIESFRKLNVSFYIAGCSDRVYDTMVKCDLVGNGSEAIKIFPSIHDAVECVSFILGIHSAVEDGISRIT
ncbi:unnamed protein product [Phaedon cochleariae]|uniref:STAS domain-containing protein n=1 Tax=Phaedon cochleariae TaxID=80249 RepID=A0A9P0DPR8_PHACE|nr:unnamed protein product [Phaedon cochleariae]